MQDEADAQLKWIRKNMSEAPDRITATFNNWRNPNAGAFYKNNAGDSPYVRADAVQALIDSAVKAERERCAKVAEGRLGVSDALRKASFWTKGMEELVACAEEEARIIAATIRKGEQP
jgi:hypothetical protein